MLFLLNLQMGGGLPLTAKTYNSVVSRALPRNQVKQLHFRVKAVFSYLRVLFPSKSFISSIESASVYCEYLEE